MSAEDLDLGKVINALENKRSTLDSAIAALRAVISSGAMGISTEGLPNGAVPLSSLLGGNEIPDGAFNGKSMSAAIKLYLEIMRSKKTLREIADGLKNGGYESTSKFFPKIVYSTLDRLRKSGEVMKIGDAWGLPTWFPALMRAGAKTSKSPKATKPPKRSPRRAARPRVVSEESKDSTEETGAIRKAS